MAGLPACLSKLPALSLFLWNFMQLCEDEEHRRAGSSAEFGFLRVKAERWSVLICLSHQCGLLGL